MDSPYKLPFMSDLYFIMSYAAIGAYYCYSFAIAVGVSIKDHMRHDNAHTVSLRQEMFSNNVGCETWFGHVQLHVPIMSLFMARNIKPAK